MAKKKSTKRPTSGKERPVGGPFLAAALLCESVLREENGVHSVIRIVDTFTINADVEAAPEGAIQVTAFAMFKAGDAEGTHEALFTLVQPDGKKDDIAKGVLKFEPREKGPHSGVSLTTPLFIRITGPGILWIELRLQGKLYTKIPIHVRFQKPTTSS